MHAHPSKSDARGGPSKRRTRSVVLATGERIDISESDDSPDACQARSRRFGHQCSRLDHDEGDHIALAFVRRGILGRIWAWLRGEPGEEIVRGVTGSPRIAAQWNDENGGWERGLG